jgi:hypothetical protein
MDAMVLWLNYGSATVFQMFKDRPRGHVVIIFRNKQYFSSVTGLFTIQAARKGHVKVTDELLFSFISRKQL